MQLTTTPNSIRPLYASTLIIIAATLPTQWNQLNAICIIFMCGLWLIDRKKLERYSLVFKSSHILLLSALFVFYMISILYSENAVKGFSHLETRFSLFAFPVVMLTFYKIDSKTLDLVLASILIACLLVSLLCLTHTIYENYVNGRTYISYYHWYYSSDSLVGRYGFHPSYFSTYLAFCIFITIHFYKKRKINLAVTVILIVYSILFQMLLASRTGVLSFMIVTILTLLYETYIRKKIWLGVLSILLFFVIMGASIYNSTILREKYYAMFNYNINQYTEAFKISKRFESWKSSLQIATDHPLLGVGIGDTKDELKKIYLERGFDEGYSYTYDSHNLFLETLVSCGILGLSLLLTMLTFAFHKAITQKNTLYLQFLLLFLLLSIPEASFSVQKGVVFFSFFNTLFLASMTNRGE